MSWVVFLHNAHFLKDKRNKKMKKIIKRHFLIFSIFVLAVCCAGVFFLRKGPSFFKKNNLKVVLFCLDGATWNLMKPLLDKNELPHFKALMERGVSGPLFSQDVFSPPCWVSIATGKNSAKHNVHTFLDGPNRRARFLWDILSDLNVRVGVFNWLMNPCEKINGVSYSCHPILKKPCTYPPLFSSPLFLAQAAKEIALARPSQWESVEIYKFLDAADKIIKNLNRFLIEHYRLEFVAVGFFGTDAYQHRYWGSYAPEYFDVSDEEVEEKGGLINSYYKKMDKELAYFMENNYTVFFVSDHGFCRNDKSAGPRLIKYFHLNSNKQHLNFLMNIFLEKLGYLHFIPRPEDGGEIDFSKSQAFFYNNPKKKIFGVRINRALVKGSSLKDTRKQIFLTLKEAHFNTGENVFIQVRENEDSENIDEPDVAFVLSPVFKKENLVVAEARGNELHLSDVKLYDFKKRILPQIIAENKEIVLKDLIDYSHDGVHEHQGVIIMSGSHIKKNHLIEGASLVDVTPTILYFLNLAIGRDMDGRVLVDAFEPDFVAKNPVRFIDSYEKDNVFNRNRKNISNDAGIDLNRMRSLGYAQ